MITVCPHGSLPKTGNCRKRPCKYDIDATTKKCARKPSSAKKRTSRCTYSLNQAKNRCRSRMEHERAVNKFVQQRRSRRLATALKQYSSQRKVKKQKNLAPYKLSPRPLITTRL